MIHVITTHMVVILPKCWMLINTGSQLDGCPRECPSHTHLYWFCKSRNRTVQLDVLDCAKVNSLQRYSCGLIRWMHTYIMICQPRENALMITGNLQRDDNTRSKRMWKFTDCIYYDAANNKYYLNTIVFINDLRTVTKKVIKQTARFLSFLAIIAVGIHS